MSPILVTDPPLHQGSGLQDEIMPGSGTALRAGVESTFRYNGLTLNDTSLLDHYRIRAIAGLDDADVKTDSEELADDDGELALSSLYRGRTITLRGMVVAHTLEKLRDMVEALQFAFQDLSPKPLYVMGGDYQRNFYIMCRKWQKIEMNEEQNDFEWRREFLVTLRAHNPRKFRIMRSLYQDVSLPAGPFANYRAFSPYNAGTFKAQPILRFTGGMEAPITVRNDVTGQQLTIDGDVPNGDWWELDIARRSLRNSHGESRLRYLTGNWIYFEPRSGNPLYLSVGGTSGSPAFTSHHSDSFI